MTNRWNAARAFATYLDQNSLLYRHQSVLELGAGGGLPGIVTAKNGARKVISYGYDQHVQDALTLVTLQVVLTDYPDAELLENLRYNVQANVPDTLRHLVDVEGYIWGQQVSPLLDLLPDSAVQSGKGFNLIILSDLIFNHSQVRQYALRIYVAQAQKA